MEGDAGSSQLNPTGGQERSDPGETIRRDTEATEESVAKVIAEQHDDAEPQASDDDAASETGGVRRPEHLGRGWFVAICAVLVLATAGVAVGGYLALRSHHQSEKIAADESAALARAKECVAATQAPDTAAMTASQSKIIECATGDYAVQANLYASMMVEAYQAANVTLQVSEMRAAVERHNDDDSVDLLVTFRVKVTNSQVANQEQGYRLRVKMAPADGTYKVSTLEQVTS
jgi:Mce-associated membrane protein